MPAEIITSVANGAAGGSRGNGGGGGSGRSRGSGAKGAAVALEGCRIWRPAFSGARVEIVSADARPRAFPLRVSETLGVCVKAGPTHGAQSDRGAVPAWRNEMAEMMWFYWLTYDGLSAADRVTTPALFVHGDGCAFPDHVRQIHARVRGPKHLVWEEGSQIDFYDQPRQVDAAIKAVTSWFAQTVAITYTRERRVEASGRSPDSGSSR